MAAKLTRMSHQIVIQLHLVAECCTICSSRSRWPVRNLWIHPRIHFVWELFMYSCYFLYSWLFMLYNCSDCRGCVSL